MTDSLRKIIGLFLGLLGLLLYSYIDYIFGWKQISKTRATRKNTDFKTKRNCNMRLQKSIINYPDAYFAAVVRDGVYIQPLFPINIFRPPVLLQWNDYTESHPATIGLLGKDKRHLFSVDGYRLEVSFKFDHEERHFNEAVKALPANEAKPPVTDCTTNPSIHREAQ